LVIYAKERLKRGIRSSIPRKRYYIAVLFEVYRMLLLGGVLWGSVSGLKGGYLIDLPLLGVVYYTVEVKSGVL